LGGFALSALIFLRVLTGFGARQPGVDWQQAPAYVALFAPSGARADAYRTFVSPLDLDTLLDRLGPDVSVVRPPGAWEPRPQLPFDAFGQTGPYDRSKLARLYGARRPRVARGPRAENGRIVEAWTLISPYPDPKLEHLEAGTLLIVLRVP
jgi:hypothetical protein